LSIASENTAKKIPVPGYFLIFLAALVASGPMTMDAYLPAMPIMAEYFSVNIVSINNTIPFYLAGYALGQVFAGPISDQIGRKPVALFGLVIFVITSLAIALATTVTEIQFLRLVQAIGGGSATVICMPSIRDVYSAREAGRKFAIVMMIMMLAPLVAPAIGAVLLKISWQAIFYFLATYGLLLFIFYLFGMPETKHGPKEKISIPSILSQYLKVITHKVDNKYIAIRYAITMAISGGIMLTFLTNVSFAYIQYFGISESNFPVYFACIPIGFMITNMASMKMMKNRNPQTLYKVGNVLQLFTLITLTLVVYFDAMTLFLFVPLITISIAWGGFISPCASAMYMSYFKKLSGSAASLMSTMMFTLGGILGYISGIFFDDTLLPMVATMLTASFIANILAWSIPDAEILEHD
jgi:DHA1 family bicyclomycin/chloramphenicol resistance-like MFS transporter